VALNHFYLRTGKRTVGFPKTGIMSTTCRLSGVMVSVLAIRPKVRGFKPGRGDGLLRTIKIRTTPSFGREVKPSVC
jgi:hypothetical protein